MSEENISLFDLLDLSIGTPQKGAVNFSALHDLLHAVLRQLNILETKTRWRDAPPGGELTGALEGVTEEDHHTEEGGYQMQEDTAEQEDQPGAELQDQTAASSSPNRCSGSGADGQVWTSRIQTCEDDVSKALKLIEELHSQKQNLKEEIKELRHQQKMVSAQTETVSAVEKCFRRVDVLEDTVRSLSDTLQKRLEPAELSLCVTWDEVQSVLLSERENLQEDRENSAAVDAATNAPFNHNFSAVNATPPHASTPSASEPAAPSSPSTAGQITTLREATDSRAATEAPSGLSGPLQGTEAGQGAAGLPLSGKAGRGSERYPEAVEALRNMGKLREKFGELEARVAALEEGKVNQSQLTPLRELITKKGSHDASNNPMNELTQQRALIERLMSDREKNVQLVNDVQTTFLQLQAECERLHESTRCLHEDSRQKESHIQELYKTTEELEEKKADRQMVESEIKADKSALESKVSRLQFDSVTEQLSAMFHELLDKVTGQEQDWHKVIDRLSTEMDCKLNRIELDSVKKQLEDRWRNINKKLQALEAPEHGDAAVLRKQLLDRFHCLSCDRPVVKYTSGQFPSNKSIRPFTVYAVEQFRQHHRSERSCGGSHTVNLAGQRRQATKHNTQIEMDLLMQSEEVDIIGRDGHIYKGRLNTPAVRNTETKLPTISTKDGMCKTKDKAKPTKPAASPEAGYGAPLHPHSAKSAQCSHSASSGSGRDWPVSALGCTSRSSFTPPSAAAESNSELLDL